MLNQLLLLFLGCPSFKNEAEGTEDNLQVSSLTSKEFQNLKDVVEITSLNK